MILKFLISRKLNVSPSKIADTQMLSDIANGNSALKNELAGILMSEMSLSEEHLEKEAIGDLAKRVRVAAPGKHLAKAIAQAYQDFLPVGFRAPAVSAFLDTNAPSLDAETRIALTAEWLCSVVGNAPISDVDAAAAQLRDVLRARGIAVAAPVEVAVASATMPAGANVCVTAALPPPPPRFSADAPDAYAAACARSDADAVAARARVVDVAYAEAMQPIFAKERVRTYQSWRNWTKQHALQNTALPGYMENNTTRPCPIFILQDSTKLRECLDMIKDTTYRDAVEAVIGGGITMCGRVALVTGTGAGSIGEAVVAALLFAGARVYTTTSRADPATYARYQSMYQSHGCAGSTLCVIPCNLQSDTDLSAAVSCVFEREKHIDVFVPFQAIGMYHSLGAIDAHDELGFRLMVTQVYKAIGNIQRRKPKQMQTQVVLPLSPNVGTFGYDGLYADSKLALRSVYHKCVSENLQKDFVVCGLKIGWTNSALMAGAARLSAAVEREFGVPTFSPAEMAAFVVACFEEGVVDALYAGHCEFDVSFGLDTVPDFAARLRALSVQREPTAKKTNTPDTQRAIELDPRAHITLPDMKVQNEEHDVLLDLDRVVVVVGYGELGPWGTAAVRWDVERDGVISVESCAELGLIVGMQKELRALGAHEFYKQYHETITEKCGIREIAELLRREGLVKKTLEADMDTWIECETLDEVREYRERYGDKCCVQPVAAGGDKCCVQPVAAGGDKCCVQPVAASAHDAAATGWGVRLLRGADVYVRRSVPAEHFVAGYVPDGFDPAALGVPEHIVRQVDPTVLYALVAVAEAFVRMGVSDPYELYRYMHPREFGNVFGSGIGGLKHMQDAFYRRIVGEHVKSDTIQDMLINVIPAWINMLALGACGPMSTPVQACATSAVSVDMAVSLLQEQRARVVLVGGAEDTCAESITEFGAIGALIKSRRDAAAGRAPREASRPCSSTRAGFTESSGAGAQILTTARFALEYGFPIYGVIAHTHTACDGFGTSVPAPGKGVLGSVAGETDAAAAFAEQRARIAARASTGTDVDADVAHYIGAWWRARGIAPLEAALRLYGCSADDIDVVSFHGTSTPANDLNESQIVDAQLRRLGRRSDTPACVVAQKWLTGHAKGAAFAFMLNGALDMLRTSVVPGNRNLDDLAPELADFDLLYPNRSVHLASGVSGVLLKSFGFGQAGAEVLVLHPRVLLRACAPAVRAAYAEKVRTRHVAAQDAWHARVAGQTPWVHVQKQAAFEGTDTYTAPATCTYTVPKFNRDIVLNTPALPLQIADTLDVSRGARVGVDIEYIGTVEWDDTFVSRNFTEHEIAYAAGERRRLLGMWACKEAFAKACGRTLRRDFSELRCIEVIHDMAGAPRVVYTASDGAQTHARASVSYTMMCAIAVVVVDTDECV